MTVDSRCSRLSWFVLFFCFKQKPAYEMRISDWSSDVCSSVLAGIVERHHAVDVRMRDTAERWIRYGIGSGADRHIALHHWCRLLHAAHAELHAFRVAVDADVCDRICAVGRDRKSVV